MDLLEENHLIKLLEYFPDADWDMYCVQENPNITPEYIMNNFRFNIICNSLFFTK